MSIRLNTLLSALDGSPAAPNRIEAVTRVARHLDEGGVAELWLAHAVLRGEYPTRDEVVDARRELRLRGARTVVRRLLARPARRKARVVTGAVLVDVQHTARTSLATGIQRVVRNTIQQWDASKTIELIGWSPDFRGIRRLSAEEQENALHGTKAHAKKAHLNEITIPWRSSYILPELAIEDERVTRIAALAEFSGNDSCVIGYDCVPLTTADTVGGGMGAAFGRNLSAVARMDRVATISIAAATEYEGWRSMLQSAGLTGPDVREVILPAEAGEVTEQELADARATLVTDGLPLVVVVGSHEPRKNHLAALTAAEQLWSAGREFSLVFIGGNAWASEQFVAELDSLARRGRPVRSISAVTDQLLWSAYRLAAVTLFPSLNEGFGLPVAESLAVGTPVITSGYGSMQEIARFGGALLVDPRDDSSIAAALESALFDPAVAARLRAEAAAMPSHGWSDYATELWDYFVPQAKL